MAGEDRGTELPRRIRGEAWTGPLSSAVPVLSPELRQCMQAAVRAERAAVAREQPHGGGDRTAGPPRRVPLPRSAAGEPRAAARREPAARARATARPDPAVRPQPGQPRRRAGGRRLVALGVALIVTGSLAAFAAMHFSRPPAGRQAAWAAARAQAAAWVAGQVSPDVSVSCDAVMCAALKAHGFPAGQLVMFADLAESVPATHVDTAAYMRAAWAVLSRTAAGIRPARAVSGTLQHQAASGTVQRQAVLRVEFTAPSPLSKSATGLP